MESAKIVNKILLSSLAFGVVTLGVGMLVKEDNLKKALMTTGAVGSMTCVAGALVTNGRRSSEDSQVDNLLENRVQELHNQEIQLQQSFNEATAKMQRVEADINSLQTEHNQLLSVISDLNSQKQQLDIHSTNIEAQKAELKNINDQLSQAKKQEEELYGNLTNLESRKQELESENNSLQTRVEELYIKEEQLNQIIAPIEQNLTNVEIQGTQEEKLDNFEEDSELPIEQLVGSLDESDLEVFNNEQLSTESKNNNESELISSQEVAGINNNLEFYSKSNSFEEDSETEVNPFISSFDSSEPSKFEEDSELPIEKLVGSLDESDLEAFDQQLSIDLETSSSLESATPWENADAQEEQFSLQLESEAVLESEDLMADLETSSSLESPTPWENADAQEEQFSLQLESEAEAEIESEDLMADLETSSSLESPTPWENADAQEEQFSLQLESEAEIESEDLMGDFDSSYKLEEAESETAIESEDLMGDLETSGELESATPWESADGKEDEFSLELESEASLELQDLMSDFETSSELEEDSIAQAGNSIDNFGQISEGILTTEEELNEFSSLELVEKKLDMLNQISDESLEELKDLLDFVQENDSLMDENQKLDGIQAREKQ